MSPNESTIVIALAALLMLSIAEGVVLLGVLNYLARVQSRLPVTMTPSGARKGEPAPEFSAVDLAGRHIGSDTLRGRFAGLLFVSPHCPSCMTTLAEIHYLGHKVLGNLTIICKGSDVECADLAQRYALSLPIVADENDWLGQQFGVSGTPTAILLDEMYKVVARGEPGTPGEIRGLLQQQPADASEAQPEASAAPATS